MSQITETFPLLPASQEEHPITPPVIIAVPIQQKKGPGRPKKPVTEEEKAAAEAAKAQKEAEKAQKEAEKKAKEEEKAKKEAEKAAEKAAKEAAKTEKDANKKPRGRPPKTATSPTVSPVAAPAHNQEDIAEIAHLQEDRLCQQPQGVPPVATFRGRPSAIAEVAADENELASLRLRIASLQAENKRLNNLLMSVRSLVSV
jgi:chemotaxis protein histidine kinase CheA